MSDSPSNDNWLVRHRWLILIALTGCGALLTQFQHIEPNTKRIAELMGLYVPAPKMSTAEPQKTEPPKAEAPKKAEPPKPTVACLASGLEMMAQIRALKGDAWEPHFNAHFKNRETCLVMPLTEVVDGRFKFVTDDDPNVGPIYYVVPRYRADLKKFAQPGRRLLVEGDLERYTDTGSGQPDVVTIVRARITEAKESGVVTGGIRR